MTCNLAQAVRIHPAGFAAIEAGSFRAMPSAIAEAALAALARTIGGGAYPVRAAGVTRLRDRLADMSFSGYTLGGCRFVRWRKWVLVLREPAAAQAPVGLSPGTAVGWDRRYRFSLGATAPGPVTVGCLGQARSLGLDCRIGRSQRGDLPRLVHSALPAAWNQTEVIGVPHLGYRGRPGRGACRRSSSSPSFHRQALDLQLFKLARVLCVGWVKMVASRSGSA